MLSVGHQVLQHVLSFGHLTDEVPRTEGVHSDPLAAGPLLGQVPGQPEDAGLAGGVRRLGEPRGDVAEHAGHVDDRRTGRHQGCARLSHPEGAAEVHVEDLAESLGRLLAGGHDGADACVVHQHVDPSEDLVRGLVPRLRSPRGTATSARTVTTRVPVARSESASSSSRSRRRAARTRSAPAAASACANPRPRPEASPRQHHDAVIESERVDVGHRGSRVSSRGNVVTITCNGRGVNRHPGVAGRARTPDRTDRIMSTTPCSPAVEPSDALEQPPGAARPRPTRPAGVPVPGRDDDVARAARPGRRRSPGRWSGAASPSVTGSRC